MCVQRGSQGARKKTGRKVYLFIFSKNEVKMRVILKRKKGEKKKKRAAFIFSWKNVG